MTQQFITGLELNKEANLKLLNLALQIKNNPMDFADALKGKSVVTLFEKPSLRTRLSFDIGINKLGGHAVYLDQQNGAMGQRESVKDFADRELFPYFKEMDENPAYHKDGKVFVHDQVKKMMSSYVGENSEFDVLNRSGVMSRCETISRTWSGVPYTKSYSHIAVITHSTVS